MTSLDVPHAVKSIVWRWVTHGFSALGSAMTVGRIPVEIAVRALHLEPEHLAKMAQHSAGQD